MGRSVRETKRFNPSWSTPSLALQAVLEGAPTRVTPASTRVTCAGGVRRYLHVSRSWLRPCVTRVSTGNQPPSVIPPGDQRSLRAPAFLNPWITPGSHGTAILTRAVCVRLASSLSFPQWCLALVKCCCLVPIAMASAHVLQRVSACSHSHVRCPHRPVAEGGVGVGLGCGLQEEAMGLCGPGLGAGAQESLPPRRGHLFPQAAGSSWGPTGPSKWPPPPDLSSCVRSPVPVPGAPQPSRGAAVSGVQPWPLPSAETLCPLPRVPPAPVVSAGRLWERYSIPTTIFPCSATASGQPQMSPGATWGRWDSRHCLVWAPSPGEVSAELCRAAGSQAG